MKNHEFKVRKTKFIFEESRNDFFVKDTEYSGWLSDLFYPVPLYFNGLPQYNYEFPDTGVRFLSLHVSHNCNMNCTYCYGGERGTYGSREKVMSKEVLKKAIDFGIKHCAGEIHINFFGGEPLLAFSTIEYAVKYALKVSQKRNIKVSFSISTNGSLITEYIADFLQKYKFQVSISIDGSPQAHNRHRKFVNGNPTYNKVIEGLYKLLRRRINVLCTATLTSANSDMVENFRQLYQRGIKNFRYKLVVTSKHEIIPGNMDLNKICNSYVELADLIIKKYIEDRDLRFGDIEKYIKRIYLKQRVHINCAAGLSFFNIAPNGEVYLCHKFMNNPLFLLGNVMDKVDFEKFRVQICKTPVEERNNCRDCWAKFLCGGGCYYDNYFVNKEIFNSVNVPKCKITRTQIEVAAYVLYKLAFLKKGICKRFLNEFGNYEAIV